MRKRLLPSAQRLYSTSTLMQTPRYSPLANWAIFAVLMCFAPKAIEAVVLSSYHPNAASSPYYQAAGDIWAMFTAGSLLAATLSILGRRLSIERTWQSTRNVYGLLLLLALIRIILTKPVPAYFIQSFDGIDYRVPREFTSVQNLSSGLRLDICIDTLTGTYEKPSVENCDYSTVLVKSPSEDLSYFSALFAANDLFGEPAEFELDSDRLTSLGLEKYRIESPDSLKSYAIITPPDQRFNPTNSETFIRSSIHFQIDAQDKLVRFVECQSTCEQWVKTPQAALNYSYDPEGNPDFDLTRWNQTETNILNLITSWKTPQNQQP